MSDSFVYHRVTRPAMQQFARLAINSNEQHPTHRRGALAAQPPVSAATPFSPAQLYNTLLAVLSPAPSPADLESGAVAGVATSFPAPLVALILDYALCSSFIAAEASGALHEHWWQEYKSESRHWRATHSDTLTAVACLPDGQHCATASLDGSIVVARQCNTAVSDAEASGPSPQWRETRRIEHKHAVHSLLGALLVDTQQEADPEHSIDTATPDPPSLVSALVVGSSAGLFVYCPFSGRMLHELSGHTNRVSALCALPSPSSHSASVVVSASWDGSCRVWSLHLHCCDCLLRGRGKPLTCVTAVDRGCVVAGDVGGGVSLWQFGAAMRTAAAASTQSHEQRNTNQPPSAISSSIASIRIAGHTSAAYLFRSPDPPAPALMDVPSVQASSHFCASSAATRSVLSIPSSGLLWVGSDDGLRLFAPSSSSGSWLSLRRIVTCSPLGAPYLPVHSLVWLSSSHMVVSMGKHLAVWNCEPLLHASDDALKLESAVARVRCDYSQMDALMNVRGLAARQWLDITQSMQLPDNAANEPAQLDDAQSD